MEGKKAFIDSLFDDRGLFDSFDGASEMNLSGYPLGDAADVRVESTHPVSFTNAGNGETSTTGNEGLLLSSVGDDFVCPSRTHECVESGNEWVPTEGSLAENVIEAFIMYSEYARQCGFEVRFRSSELTPSAKKALEEGGVDHRPRQRTKRGIGRNWLHDGYEFCSRVRLQCVKGEKWRSNRRNPERPVRTQATNCKAGVSLVKKGDGTWEFRKVVLEHNHDCDPDSTRFMKNYRIVSGVDEMQIVLGDRAGVTPSRGYMSFVVGNGGIENVPFSQKDSHSVLRRWRLKGMENGDFNAMQKFFNNMKTLSEDFFYAYDTDGEGRVKNVFWADARARAAYHDFGDVVCFDTTHLKNRYKMPLAPFIGVNHHGQSILLGCALLSNEDTESFKWVFETWLHSMRDKVPMYIMTDQCQAIGNALACVFPNTRHRWCLWHVMRNAELHLRKKNEWPDIRRDLSDIVHGSYDSIEFEGMWSNFIAKFSLGENKWLQNMFEVRERWVPAYFLHEFWAGMHSTQRSEGMNNFFRSYVNINTGLKQFAEQYCLAVGKRVDDEEKEDWKSKNKPIKCATIFPSEVIFQRFYTVNKFLEFQNEAKGVAYVNTERLSFDGVVRCQKVTDRCVVNGFGRTSTKQFTVLFEVESKRTTCGCKLFEFKGIICRHIVAVWQDEDLDIVPPMYILDRWRKDVFRRLSIVRIPNHLHVFGRTEDESRCEQLQKAMRAITDLAMGHEGIFKTVMEDLEVLKQKCKDMLNACEEVVRIDSVGRQYRTCIVRATNVEHLDCMLEHCVQDPVDRRGKGRVPTRRKGSKSGKRKRSKKAKAIMG